MAANPLAQHVQAVPRELLENEAARHTLNALPSDAARSSGADAALSSLLLTIEQFVKILI